MSRSQCQLRFHVAAICSRAAPSLAAAAGLPGGLVGSASAAANTLVIAAPATPQSLDCNFDVSLGTFEAIAALYDNLLDFKKIPDPKQPGAFREDTADHPDLPAGLAIQGKLRRVVRARPRPASSSAFSCVRGSRATGAMSSPRKT